jgi:integrase
LENILESMTVESYCEFAGAAKGTSILYKTVLTDFAIFKFQDQLPVVPPYEKPEKRKKRGKVYNAYLDKKRALNKQSLELLDQYITRTDIDGYSDVDAYIKYRDKLGKNANTTSVYITVLRDFLKAHNVQFNEVQSRRMLKPKNGHVTDDAILDMATIDRLYLNAGSNAARLLTSVLTCTGCRIDEIVNIKLTDIHLEDDPAWILLPKTKNGQERSVFINEKTKGSLKEWKENGRMLYLVDAAKKGKQLAGAASRIPPEEDERLFGFGYDTARVMLMQAVKKMNKGQPGEKDTVSNRYKIHLHSFRKHFSSVLIGHVPERIIDFWMGHKHGLDISYFRKHKQELGDQYKKIQHLLTIGEGEETKTIREKQEKQDEILLVQQKEIEELKRMVAIQQQTMEANVMTIIDMNKYLPEGETPRTGTVRAREKQRIPPGSTVYKCQKCGHVVSTEKVNFCNKCGNSVIEPTIIGTPIYL